MSFTGAVFSRRTGSGYFLISRIAMARMFTMIALKNQGKDGLSG
jgi:hypothetical protein